MMDAPMAAGMREATHLTRAGQLYEAVAIIQRTLQGVLGSSPAADAPRAAAETTIEGRCRVIGDEMGTYANEPQRRYSLGPAAIPGHTEASPEPTAASRPSLPGLPARSSTAIELTRGGSTWPGYRPAARWR